MTTTIIASDAEVRAWMAGATAFRRPLKPRGICAACMSDAVPHPAVDGRLTAYLRVGACEHNGVTGKRVVAPWEPGDVLRVREAHRFSVSDGTPKAIIQYRADGAGLALMHADEGNGDLVGVGPAMEPADWGDNGPAWRSAATMPAWASRMSIRVTGVGIERDGDGWMWVVTFERVTP